MTKDHEVDENPREALTPVDPLIRQKYYGSSKTMLERLRAAINQELPRTHKGFRCQYEQDSVMRALDKAFALIAPDNELELLRAANDELNAECMRLSALKEPASPVETSCAHVRAEGERKYFGPYCSKCGADLPEEPTPERLYNLGKLIVDTARGTPPEKASEPECSWGCYYVGDKLVRNTACTLHGASEKASELRCPFCSGPHVGTDCTAEKRAAEIKPQNGTCK